MLDEFVNKILNDEADDSFFTYVVSTCLAYFPITSESIIEIVAFLIQSLSTYNGAFNNQLLICWEWWLDGRFITPDEAAIEKWEAARENLYSFGIFILDLHVAYFWYDLSYTSIFESLAFLLVEWILQLNFTFFYQYREEVDRIDFYLWRRFTIEFPDQETLHSLDFAFIPTAFMFLVGWGWYAFETWVETAGTMGASELQWSFLRWWALGLSFFSVYCKPYGVEYTDENKERYIFGLFVFGGLVLSIKL